MVSLRGRHPAAKYITSAIGTIWGIFDVIFTVTRKTNIANMNHRAKLGTMRFPLGLPQISMLMMLTASTKNIYGSRKSS